jgi:hypothetical protein
MLAPFWIEKLTLAHAFMYGIAQEQANPHEIWQAGQAQEHQNPSRPRTSHAGRPTQSLSSRMHKEPDTRMQTKKLPARKANRACSMSPDLPAHQFTCSPEVPRRTPLCHFLLQDPL